MKLSERLEKAAEEMDRRMGATSTQSLLREAATLARRVENSVCYEVEPCRVEIEPEDFDLRGSIDCAASLIGQRVRLVPEVGNTKIGRYPPDPNGLD